MKKIISLILVVCLIASVSVVFAEEVGDSPETSLPDVPSEEPSGGEGEDGSEDPSGDTGDGGDPDDSDGVSSDPEDTDPSDLEPIPEVGEELPEEDLPEEDVTPDLNLDGASVVINAEQVLLAGEEDPVTYASGNTLSGCYLVLDTSELGEIKVYIPVDYQQGSFSYDNYSSLVNIRSSTITGYTLDGSNWTIRWPTFGTPQYRATNSSGYTWSDLTVNDVVDTNVQVVDDDYDLPLFPADGFLTVTIIMILGVLLICQFMKQ